MLNTVGHELISRKVFSQSVCKSQLPHKSANLSFTVTNIKNKLTGLCENGHLQNDLKNTLFEVRTSSCLTPATVWGAGCRVQGAGCRVQGAGCRVQGAGCRVQGCGVETRGTVTSTMRRSARPSGRARCSAGAGRGSAIAEDARGTPTPSRISPRIL